MLMGFMGAGKSTVGPLLAKRVGYTFVDLDQALSLHFAIPANRQLTEVGESEFRRREAIVLEEVLQGRRLVLALGGGTVTDARSRSVIRAHGGCLVWLDVDWATVARRLRGSTRPLWQGSDWERRLLFDGRQALYASLAEVRVDARPDARTVAAEAVGNLEAHGVV
jgi:shikimate kinase